MGKGEIARYEQFLLFPQCFQKAFFPGASKGVIVWEWVNYSNNVLYLFHDKAHQMSGMVYWCRSSTEKNPQASNLILAPGAQFLARISFDKPLHE